jgi:hypothetical protein
MACSRRPGASEPMIEVGPDRLSTQLAWVSFTVKQDVLPCPVSVALGGARTVVTAQTGQMDLLKQSGTMGFGWRVMTP